MTDQRYTGPYGAKRLEMLEELAKDLDRFRAFVQDRWPKVFYSLYAIHLDNRRVDRLEKKQPTSTRVALDFPLPRYTTRLK